MDRRAECLQKSFFFLGGAHTEVLERTLVLFAAAVLSLDEAIGVKLVGVGPHAWQSAGDCGRSEHDVALRDHPLGASIRCRGIGLELERKSEKKKKSFERKKN